MARLRSPLASLQATGRLMSHFSFLRRRHTDIVESTPIPKDARSLAQLSWRHMYQKAVALWQALSDAEKQSWESLARPFHMTGFAYFISQALKPNPGLYLPLQGGKMAGDIDMDGFKIEDLPAPTADQEAATKKYVDDSMPVGGYTEGARVYHDVHQSIPHATLTTLAFNSERYDTDTIHDLIINNSRLTCKTAGKYLITACAQFASNVAGRRQCQIWFNGVTTIGQQEWNTNQVAPTNMSCATIFNLAVNDFVQFKVYQTRGGALNINAALTFSPEFMMQRIG